MITVTVECETPEQAAIVAGALNFHAKAHDVMMGIAAQAMRTMAEHFHALTPQGEQRLMRLKDELRQTFEPLDKLLKLGKYKDN